MNLVYENKKLAEGYNYVVGCDEVGRGCLAGPVVAAAVVLEVRGKGKEVRLDQVKDSKLLSSKKREELSKIIKDIAVAWSIAEVTPKEIDEINIHNASLLAMKKAVNSVVRHCEGVHPTEAIFALDEIAASPVKALTPRNDKVFIFIDGKFKIPNFDVDQEAIIKGDNKVLSIAAASIIAKVYRDELMQKFHQTFPIYNFAQHKGYATAYHRQIIFQHGLSPIHRLTFCTNFL